jgi:hypothetical protein
MFVAREAYARRIAGRTVCAPEGEELKGLAISPRQESSLLLSMGIMANALNVVRILTIALTLIAVGCAAIPTETVKILSEAKGSGYFSLGAPGMSKTATGQTLAGRVCRLAQSTLLSPPAIRIDHLDGAGRRLETAHAYVPEIYLARDQTCSDYAAKVAWTLSPGDKVRACFDRGAACPAQAQSKAVINAPAAP